MVWFGIAIALAAAVRSTWSPCGLSMLSQITPVGEAGRGERYARTARWFVAGAALGGAVLGAAIAAAAALVAAVGIGSGSAYALLTVGAFGAALVDARVLGFGPPFVRRQVNAAWLANFRPWVYGGGFGAQIGAGVTTYVMTAAVPLAIVVGALSANARTGLLVGVTFGLTRGLAVLLGAGLRTAADLFAFHRRFDTWAEPVRRAVIGVELAAAVAGAWLAGPPIVAVAVSLAAAALLGRVTGTRSSRAAARA